VARQDERRYLQCVMYTVSYVGTKNRREKVDSYRMRSEGSILRVEYLEHSRSAVLRGCDDMIEHSG
jgi:hypothetical protein